MAIESLGCQDAQLGMASTVIYELSLAKLLE